MPIAVKNARKGKLKYIVGNGRNLMDFTYVGNVAQAHVQVSTPQMTRTFPANPVLSLKDMCKALLSSAK